MKPEQELKTILGTNVRIRREKMRLTQEELSERMGLIQEELSKRMGLTQVKLSEKAGVSKNTISDIEGGQKFARAKTLFYLAKALGTEVYELLKPANVQPDKAADIIARYSDKVRDAVGELEKNYMGNVGK
jgi:transcriptional regulator with XRE-family HTH domain